MFHVHIGVTDNNTDGRPEMTKVLRLWESKFSSDPLIYHSSRSSDQESEPQEIPELVCDLSLFRDYAGLLEGVPFDILPVQRGCRLLLLGVPVGVSIESIIKEKRDDIKYFSVLCRSKSGSPVASFEGDFDRSLMLLFHDQRRADAFFRDWHLQFFDISQTAGPVCYLVFIDRMKIDFSDSDTYKSPAPLGSQQIPSCPFCIERIDVNISGVITSRRGWLSNDSMLASSACVPCSVQRRTEDLRCMICDQDQLPLWVCLLCGHLGCGRYAKGDAWSHFQASGHRLSLELVSGRIWDYHSDQFVHRRIAARGSILDLPERVDTSTLPVHPQVSFEEDIRELNATMTSQLTYERSKYEEACTQLRILGASRVEMEEELLAKEREEEKALRAEVKLKQEELKKIQSEFSNKNKVILKVEKEISLQRKQNKEMKDKLEALLRKGKPEISPHKLKELEILKIEAEKLRLKLAAQC